MLSYKLHNTLYFSTMYVMNDVIVDMILGRDFLNEAQKVFVRYEHVSSSKERFKIL